MRSGKLARSHSGGPASTTLRSTPRLQEKFNERRQATEHANVFAEQLATVARSHGISDLARRSGLSRPEIYKALGEDGNPSFETIRSILSAMGLRLTVEPDAQMATAQIVMSRRKRALRDLADS
jgi:probable addiction module antidote protein